MGSMVGTRMTEILFIKDGSVAINHQEFRVQHGIKIEIRDGYFEIRREPEWEERRKRYKLND